METQNPRLRRELILPLFRRKDQAEKAVILLNLIDSKIQDGRVNLILSFGLNQDFYEQHGLSGKNLRSLLAKLREAGVLTLVKEHRHGSHYEEHQVSFRFVEIPENLIHNSRQLYYACLRRGATLDEGFQLWLSLKADVYSSGAKRATFKKLAEAAEWSGKFTFSSCSCCGGFALLAA